VTAIRVAKTDVREVVEAVVGALVKVLAKEPVMVVKALVVGVQVVQELVKAPVNMDVREATNTKIIE